MQLNFIYSDAFDEERIQNTLQRYKWYVEQRYRVNLPESIRAMAEAGEEVSSEKILSEVKATTALIEYQKAAEDIMQELTPKLDKFARDLDTLGGVVHEAYDIYITKYGVGGSYFWPNKVILNIDYGVRESWKTIVHEIVHLSIQDKIQEFQVSHWAKERLVDLIINKFFPEHQKLQRDPQHPEEIERIFSLYFPDMRKVISEVGLIENKK